MRAAFKSVRVLGKVYSVLWGHKFDEMILGDHCQKSLQVRIGSGMAPDEERETLMHELTHAVENQLGLDLKEEQVRQLSVGMFAVFRDNPKLVSYMFKRGAK